MSKNRIDYSQENYPTTRMPIGIDFSKQNIINLPQNQIEHNNIQEEEIAAEIVSFTKTDRTVRPYRSKIQLGSYISKDNLQRILKKEQKDRSFYGMLEYMRKNDRTAIALKEDFDLLRDFFPAELVLEVEDYTNRIIAKIEKETVEQGNKKLTPRKRRGYILAVFRSVCRKNGRKFTERLLDEINKRFNYDRTIKLFEICKAENELINWHLLSPKPKKSENDLKTFYLHIINNVHRLRKTVLIEENAQYLEILSITQKYVTSFAKDKDKRKALSEILKHQDNDFAARLILWSIAKHFAKEKFDYNFKSPELVPGWKELFMIKKIANGKEEQIPIRSFKYCFWAEFNLRKELKDNGLFPETTEEAEE
ncbi:MAG: hypothetical protein FK734_00420 [Asgard group archaeon]|nr:hypothetical protein [Asgard group archaeon]